MPLPLCLRCRHLPCQGSHVAPYKFIGRAGNKSILPKITTVQNLFCGKFIGSMKVTASPLLLCHYVTFPLSEESHRPLQNELPYGMNWLRHELNYVHELHLWCIKTACGFPYYLLLIPYYFYSGISTSTLRSLK